MFYINMYRDTVNGPEKHELIIHCHRTMELMKRLLIFRLDINKVEFRNASGRVFFSWNREHAHKQQPCDEGRQGIPCHRRSPEP